MKMHLDEFKSDLSYKEISRVFSKLLKNKFLMTEKKFSENAWLNVSTVYFLSYFWCTQLYHYLLKCI